jgi:dynein heavy chain
MQILNIKLATVKAVKDKVAKLEAECKMMQDEKDGLEAHMDQCEKRMSRAERLVVLLEDEGIRWKETVEILNDDIEKLIGNVFLSCASISYIGGFTGSYRQEMVSGWINQCKEREIPTSNDFSVIKIMGDPV